MPGDAGIVTVSVPTVTAEGAAPPAMLCCKEALEVKIGLSMDKSLAEI